MTALRLRTVITQRNVPWRKKWQNITVTKAECYSQGWRGWVWGYRVQNAPKPEGIAKAKGLHAAVGLKYSTYPVTPFHCSVCCVCHQNAARAGAERRELLGSLPPACWLSATGCHKTTLMFDLRSGHCKQKVKETAVAFLKQTLEEKPVGRKAFWGSKAEAKEKHMGKNTI